MRWYLLTGMTAFALVGTFVVAPALADDKKEEKKDTTFDFPNLEAKEWKKLDSGLKVWDVKEGKGDPAKANAKVKANYTGWLTDGKAFDSSLDAKFEHKEPLEFTLKTGRGGVIQGWVEGVEGMKPGGVRRLIIPPELAYRKTPPDGSGIPKDATLVFVVEYIGPADK